MAWIAYFLVGSKPDARKFCQLRGSEEQYLTNIFRVETRMWNTALLTTLHQTIKDENINIDKAELIPLGYGSEKAPPWLWQVHKEVVEHLTDLDSSALTKLAKLWLRRDKVLQTYSNCTEQLVRARILELQQASILSSSKKVPVHLYVG